MSSLVLGLALLARGESPVEDFEKQPELSVYKGDERGGGYVLETAPESRGISGKATWKDGHYKYLEYNFKNSIPLPEFNEKLDGTLSVWVFADKGNRAENGIGLRLIDSKGEVFQYDSPVKGPLRQGWQKLTYRITPDNASSSWGGGADKKFDLPARLLGFVIGFNPEIQGAGSVYLDDITHSGLNQNKVEFRKQQWTFDRTERWNASGLQENDELKLDEKGKLQLSLKSGADSIRLARREDQFRDAGDISALVLNLARTSGNALISVVIKTKDGKKLTLKAVEAQNEVLKWNVPGDLTSSGNGISGPYFIDSIRVQRKNAGEPVLLAFDSGYVSGRVSPAEAIQVDVDTGNPVHVVKDSDTGKISLRLRNNALEAISFRLEVTLENFFSDTVDFKEDFVVPPQKELVWPIPVMPGKKGVWWVKYHLFAGGAETIGRRSFACMKPAGPTPGLSKGFLFGICSHSARWSLRDQEMEVLAAGLCGAKIIRTGVGWEGLEPQKGKWDFSLMDRLVDLYGKDGMELQAMLAFTPKWAAPPEAQNSKDWLDWNRAVPDMEAWKEYARTVAKHYDGKIRYWEVWNEPDLFGFFRGSRDDYLKMMKAAYQEIKSVDKDLQVLTGGFASLDPHPGKKDPEFHDIVIKEGEGFYDIHAFHQHGNFDSFQKIVDGKMLEIRKSLNSAKPLYFNETAIHSLGDSQRNQAEVLVKKLLFGKARGAMGYNWYDLRDDGFDPRDAEHNMGLLTNDFYPKAAYPAYNSLVLNFRGKEFMKQLDLGVNRFAFVFEGNGEQTIVAWNEASGDAGEHVVLQTDAGSAEYIDIMGNASSAPIDNGMLVLPISTTPSYLTLKGAVKAPEVKGRLIETREQAVLVPGRKGRIELAIFNPFTGDSKIELDLYTPEGVETDWKSKTVSISPSSKILIPLELTVDKNRMYRTDGKAVLKVLYRIVGSKWSGMVAVPLNMARLVDPKIGGDPDFVIDQRGNVFNMCENDPATQHLTWKGPQDLSAKIKLGYEPDYLLLQIAVEDDVHSQKFSGPFIWKGDSIQFAMQIPGQSGRWELGLARLDDGKPEVACWSRPTDFQDPSSGIGLATEQAGGRIIYKVKIPMASLGLSEKILKQGFKFNLVVNDNDGDVREGWIQIAPGIADRKDPEPYPFVVFDLP